MYHLTAPFKLPDSDFLELSNILNSALCITESSLIDFTKETLDEIYSTQAWTYIVNFVKQYGMIEFYPQIFYYRSNTTLTYNQIHIDGNTKVKFPLRFNILIKGRAGLTKWWDIDYKSNKLEIVDKQFEFVNNQGKNETLSFGTYKFKEEFVNTLPDYQTSSLYKIQESASFLRSDLLHQNYRRPEWEERLVFSVRSTQSWDTLNIL